jgi:cyclophilin family peptidyl-prolyl cis-trans isomerase
LQLRIDPPGGRIGVFSPFRRAAFRYIIPYIDNVRQLVKMEVRAMKLSRSVVILAAVAFAFSLAGPLAAQEKAQEAAKEKAGNPMVLMKTNMGNITIELFEKEAPITVKNFLNYADKKFYDGTTFHRIVPNFVIQGGGFDKDMMKKATLPAIKNEATNGLKNLKGTLSMARTSDINSATSQFFINLKDNAALDQRDVTSAGYGYAVFGKVVQGMDVVEKIAAMKTGEKAGMRDVPLKPVIIESVNRSGAAIDEPKAK